MSTTETLTALLSVLAELDEECLTGVYDLTRVSAKHGASLDAAVYAWRDAGCPMPPTTCPPHEDPPHPVESEGLPEGWRFDGHEYTDGTTCVRPPDDEGLVNFTLEAPDYSEMGRDTLEIYPDIPAVVLAAALRAGGWAVTAPGATATEPAPAPTTEGEEAARIVRDLVQLLSDEWQADERCRPDQLVQAVSAIIDEAREGSARPEAPALTDAVRELVEDAIDSHRDEYEATCPLWCVVSIEMSLHNEVHARALCIAAGVDPDEMVGGGR